MTALCRVGRGLACLLLLLVVSGCATQQALPPGAQADAHWQGKLALKVFSEPVQAFSANFDLQGRPARGELTLSSALGTTLAYLQWDEGTASLSANGKRQHFDSLQALALQATGSDLPVASLFAWLQGREEAAPGWQADLSDLPNGRIRAQRLEEIRAELKIVLER